MYRRETKMIRNKYTFSVESISTMWSSSLSIGLFSLSPYYLHLPPQTTNTTTARYSSHECLPSNNSLHTGCVVRHPRTVANYGYTYLLTRCEGLYGGECCPQDGKYNAYFSPGRCSTSYKTCTLHTGAQRAETTAYCCPG